MTGALDVSDARIIKAREVEVGDFILTASDDGATVTSGADLPSTRVEDAGGDLPSTRVEDAVRRASRTRGGSRVE